MPFNITLDRFLNESVTEYAAILDSAQGPKVTTHQDSFSKLLENEDQKTKLSTELISTIPLLPKLNEKAFEPTFNLLLHSLDVLASESSLSYESDLLPKVIAEIAKYQELSNVTVISSISVLSNIFNILPPSSALRIEIIELTLSIIKKYKLLELVEPLSKHLSVWLHNANATEAKTNKIIIQAADLLYLENQEASLALFESLIKESRAVSADDQTNYFVKLVNSKLPYKDISNLNLKLNNATLTELLSLYSNLEVPAYSAFVKKTDLSKFNIDADTLSTKLNYASITKLAANKSQITYKEVSETFGLPLSEVESYLIRCIGAKLVSGRLSQEKQIFYIHQVSKLDAVTKKDWESINESLTAWKSKIAELTELIEVLATKKNKRAGHPAVLQAFHQQKQELKEQQQQDREEKLQQQQAAAAAAAGASATPSSVTA
ncbi:unnamed protein product [Ambrosiozyma monospora]|uniref:Unnamed protein product n=1 Tax=Ambrosiozyma monospora TaxID=43982 RepID=A0ACB5T441_AMBMO|nr:unnamed protein product [Ambrosiozyma monospora]